MRWRGHRRGARVTPADYGESNDETANVNQPDHGSNLRQFTLSALPMKTHVRYLHSAFRTGWDREVQVRGLPEVSRICASLDESVGAFRPDPWTTSRSRYVAGTYRMASLRNSS